MTETLKQVIQEKSRQLGFILTGVTTPEPPPHFATFKHWLAQGHHGAMAYLADEKSLTRRADPRSILPECESILVLAIPYSDPKIVRASEEHHPHGRVAAYAWGDDYHEVLRDKLKQLVAFIEEQTGHPIPNRWYTDTGPVLERDLAQRAGLGWIGKNTCIINPKRGSYFLLAEILLGIFIEPDSPFTSDHCGTCTRCIEACPTQCILPNRTLEAQRCISYLTIELKDDIPTELRPMLKDWVFGCDICQMVCPWNRFANEDVDSAFQPREGIPLPVLTGELSLTPEAFNQKFKRNPVKRAKRRGYLRNVTIALGNKGKEDAIPALQKTLDDAEPMIHTHAQWAIEQIQKRTNIK